VLIVVATYSILVYDVMYAKIQYISLSMYPSKTEYVYTLRISSSLTATDSVRYNTMIFAGSFVRQFGHLENQNKRKQHKQCKNSPPRGSVRVRTLPCLWVGYGREYGLCQISQLNYRINEPLNKYTLGQLTTNPIQQEDAKHRWPTR